MKKQILIASLSLCLLSANAQNRSVKFEEKPLSEVIEIANNQGKLVFLDCYTSWCGPCKRMASDVFTLDRVADFFNSKFVNIKIDMEKGEGPELAKKFDVKAYPTFLLLDGNGNEVYRIVGGGNPDDFVQKVMTGMQSENWSSKLDEEYKQGNYSLEFISKYLQYLSNNGKYEKAYNVAIEVWNSLDDNQKKSKEYWNALSVNIGNLDDPRIDYMVTHLDHYKKMMGEANFDNLVLRAAYPSIFPFIMGAHEYVGGFTTASYAPAIEIFKRAKIADVYANKLIVDLSQARINNDMDQYMDIISECLPQCNDQTLISLLQSFKHIAMKGSPEQKDRAYKIIQDNIHYMKNERTREHIAKQVDITFGKS
ncbi:MAG: thioredoxin family protein [Bacteroidales bacterium]